jgi:hypothetical protein
MEQPSKSRENLVAGNLFGANDKNFTLSLCLSGTAQPVSAVSSILRTLQAAIRDAARTRPQVLAALQTRPLPILLVSTTNLSNSDRAIAFNLCFADPNTQTPISEISIAVFQSFMGAMDLAIKTMPQRTLWGHAVRLPGTTDASPSRRIAALLAEFVRFRYAIIKFDNRQVTAHNGSLEIS